MFETFSFATLGLTSRVIYRFQPRLKAQSWERLVPAQNIPPPQLNLPGGGTSMHPNTAAGAIPDVNPGLALPEMVVPQFVSVTLRVGCALSLAGIS